MSKTLSDTAAIAAKPVLQSCNPDYSGFKCAEYGRGMRNTSVGPERPAHAVQILEAKRPGS